MFCKSCQQEKPVMDFYVSNQSRCMECVRKAARANRLAKIDYYRAYDRKRASMPHRMQKNRDITERWKVLNPLRRAAQVKLGNALRDGRVKRLPCLICGGKAEAHHTDYSAPLDVVWLCPPHHKQAHALAKAA